MTASAHVLGARQTPSVGVRPWDRVGEALRAPPDGPSDHNIGGVFRELSGLTLSLSPSALAAHACRGPLQLRRPLPMRCRDR